MWLLDRIVEGGASHPVLTGTEITITFPEGVVHTEGELTGSGGCNRYSAEYSGIHGLEITEVIATEIGCLEPAGVMEQEQQFLAILARVETYYVQRDRLELSADDGTILVFVPRD
jgi:heat shock protein HslJ